jgi:hypothetical protein
MFVLALSLKEQLTSEDPVIQKMGKEDPLVSPETIILPSIKQEYIVSIMI